jgi:hypothetical protein
MKNELEKFSNFVIFQTESGKVNIDVYFQDETLWLTQKRVCFRVWIWVALLYIFSSIKTTIFSNS